VVYLLTNIVLVYFSHLLHPGWILTGTCSHVMTCWRHLSETASSRASNRCRAIYTAGNRSQNYVIADVAIPALPLPGSSGLVMDHSLIEYRKRPST